MGKRKLQAMSPAETEILRIIWELERATVQQIYEKLPARRFLTIIQGPAGETTLTMEKPERRR